jgi:hypothetical protein
MNSPNAQAYNQTIEIIIRIAWIERGCDLKNFGTKITLFGVMVERYGEKKFGGRNMNLERF